MHTAAINHVTVHAAPGQSQQLGCLLATLLEKLRIAEGCISYTAERSLQDPNQWFILGAWRSYQEMEAHFHHDAPEAYAVLLNSSVIRNIGFSTGISYEN